MTESGIRQWQDHYQNEHPGGGANSRFISRILSLGFGSSLASFVNLSHTYRAHLRNVFQPISQLGSLSPVLLSLPPSTMIWFLYKKVVRSTHPSIYRILPPFDPLKALELIKLMQKYSLVVVVVESRMPFREASER